MRVRVKDEMSGFIYGVLRTEGKEFNLKPVKHSTAKDEKGKPIITSVEQQFSDIWMEEVKKGSDDSDETEEEDEDNEVETETKETVKRKVAKKKKPNKKTV